MKYISVYVNYSMYKIVNSLTLRYESVKRNKPKNNQINKHGI